MQAPVRYSPDVEDVKPDETETIEQLNETFDTILKTVAEDSGHAVRSVHAKSHGILEGVLRIDPNLPSELAQGLFSKPGEHKVFMRMSTNAGDVLPDAVSLPRGLALKVLDVEGDRLPDAEGTTQNLIMVNGKVFQAPNTEKFLGSLKLLAKTTDRVESLKVAASTALRGVNKALHAVGIDSPTIGSLGGAPNVDPLGETYYSLTPFRYGDYIAKFSVAPVTPALTALTGTEIDASGRPNAIRETVQSEMEGIEGVWEFRVQLCRDLERQPVEDPTVEWNEEEAPFQRVGLITARPQDSWDPARVQAVDEEMRFSVWTGLAAHRPLGNINRARNAPYKHSATFRERFNGCPIHEPGAVETAIRKLIIGAAIAMFALFGPMQIQAAEPMKRDLKPFNVTIRVFDPTKGLESNQDHVLPVDSPDADHAIASTAANAASFTKKSDGGEPLPVAFTCIKVEAR